LGVQDVRVPDGVDGFVGHQDGVGVPATELEEAPVGEDGAAAFLWRPVFFPLELSGDLLEIETTDLVVEGAGHFPK
jgi:hypothetical protein